MRAPTNSTNSMNSTNSDGLMTIDYIANWPTAAQEISRGTERFISREVG